MNLLIKYAGILVLIIDVAIIAIPFFANAMSNGLVATGLSLQIIGILLTIILGRLQK